VATPPAVDAGARLTIAVLPFANLGGSAEQAWLSDGVTDDLITELSRWRMLSVRPRSAASAFAGRAYDLREAARVLDARFLVEGSIRRLGERVRITVQLVDAQTGAQAWAEKYDRDAGDLFAVQDEVVRTIVGTLAERAQRTDAERARRKPPSSLAAYECVLRGNALPWTDPAGREEATRLFRQAVALDPGWGRAHALLAAILGLAWQEREDDSPPDPESLAHALRAVELDPTDSTCHSMLSFCYLSRREFELVERHARRAVELNPTSQWNRADLGSVLLHLGKAQESVELFRQAREIDPYFEPAWYWRAFGESLMVLERYADALDKLARPTVSHYRLSAMMAACHARLGDAASARRHAARCLELKPGFRISRFIEKHPFLDQADAERLTESLRLAGLPTGARDVDGEPSWVEDVLHFWFEQVGPKQWFAKDEAFDNALRERFGALHARVVSGEEPAITATPRSALAAIVVLDQFSRNLHRGDPRAFAGDIRARGLARDALDRRFDVGLPADQRMFLYMPFQHSEDLGDQQRSVALFEALGNAEWTHFAHAHRNLIARFGRFPHRNAVLGRASTPEELDALAQPGNAF
jgi:uncharacterized protein (DUF924 family)/TolB-like protein/Flp pilus assembly protein TadD